MDPKDTKTQRISFDTETFLSTPGLYVPPLVCGSFAWLTTALDEEGNEVPTFTATIHGKADTIKNYKKILGPNVMVIGANNAYDNAVIGAEDPSALPAIFDHYDRQGFFDVLIGQALDHVAEGHLFRMPDGFSKMRGPHGEVKERYGLELVMWQRLGRQAKQRDEYRTRYGELSAIPMDQWPEAAREYPKDDVIEAHMVADDQIEKAQNMGPLIRVVPSKPPQQWEGVRVVWPGTTEPVLLTHMGLNAYAGWCLQLLSAWGLRTDPVMVRKLHDQTEATHAQEIERFTKIGFIKPDGKDNAKEIKSAIIRAYNPGRADVPCETCKGTGKVKSPKSGNPINCDPCDGTGLVLGLAPTTPAGGVKADRDTCAESGNEDLKDLKASANRKVRSTYLPFLMDGTVYPINVPSNVLMATARTSFGKQDPDASGDEGAAGLLQTFPRGEKGRIGPRECLVAPPGWVMVSNDWNAMEFAQLGQGQLYVCGSSPIVDAINSGKDPHAILGAKMLGIAYEEFIRSLKNSPDKTIRDYFKDIRQGTKAGNFGFGGRMGAAKFTLTQRRQLVGGHGSMCRLMRREERKCGSEKIDTWKRRPIDPTCVQCVNVSEELRLGWLDLWELKDYFKWVDSHEGIQDGEGVMVSVGTGFIRGGLNVSEGCNHTFQHFGGYGSKLALCYVTRECYVDRGTALYGCRPNIFAHDEIITLMPDPVLHEGAQRQTFLMKEAMRVICPDVNIGIEPAAMRRWYKAAEARYDANGRLIPWEPEAKAA